LENPGALFSLRAAFLEQGLGTALTPLGVDIGQYPGQGFGLSAEDVVGADDIDVTAALEYLIGFGFEFAKV
jgi:hypothetical protein